MLQPVPFHTTGPHTLAFSKSRSLPMVVSRRQRHSRDSSSWFLSSLTTQSCIIASVNIFSLNNSPINLIFPKERRRAMSRASSSSSFRRPRSSACQSWDRDCIKIPSHTAKMLSSTIWISKPNNKHSYPEVEKSQTTIPTPNSTAK